MRYPIGQPIRITTEVRDLGGTLVNPTTITLTVLKPDGTTQAYTSPTNDSTGLFHQDIPAADAALSGRYLYKWVSTGTGAGVSFSMFEFFDAFDVSVLSLDDARNHLGKSTTVDDAELQAFIDTAESAMARRVGYLAPTSVTERVPGRGYRLMLKEKPVISLTSVTPVGTGTALDVTQLTAQPHGSVEYSVYDCAFTAKFYDVVYKAGRAGSLPMDLRNATLEVIRHLWLTQRGGAVAVPGAANDEDFGNGLLGAAYAFTLRVRELWEPYVVNETRFHCL